MLKAVGVRNYRSLRELVMPLGALTLVTGENGSGKSNMYRALRLLAEAGQDRLMSTLAREGGYHAVKWAGPAEISPRMQRGEVPVQGTARNKRSTLRMGFYSDSFGYLVDAGLRLDARPKSPFLLEPVIRREDLWTGGKYRKASVVVGRKYENLSIKRGTSVEMVVTPMLPGESCLGQIMGLRDVPVFWDVYQHLRGWRFYDGFRTDMDAPARRPSMLQMTPVMRDDGGDLAAAVATIMDIGEWQAFCLAIDQAFPGTIVWVDCDADHRMTLWLKQPGMLRPLSAAELSDGTLRYLLLVTAVLSPRPPSLMLFNEPETSLHPSLIRPLGTLLRDVARHTQLWVVTHHPELKEILMRAPGCVHIELTKELGETKIANIHPLELPSWAW